MFRKHKLFHGRLVGFCRKDTEAAIRSQALQESLAFFGTKEWQLALNCTTKLREHSRMRILKYVTMCD